MIVALVVYAIVVTAVAVYYWMTAEQQAFCIRSIREAHTAHIDALEDTIKLLRKP